MEMQPNNDKKKIVVVGTTFPYRGGLAAFNERMALQFQAEGDDVSVETFTLQYPAFLFPGKTQYSNGKAPDLNINRSINSINPFNWKKVGLQIAKKSPDVVIFAYWITFMAPCYGKIAKTVKKHCGAKCIALVHNMVPHEPSILDMMIPYVFVNKIDAFFSLSASVARDIERYEKNPKPKSVSPHPIYDHYGEKISRTDALQKLNLPEDKKYLLFFGFIRDYKGLDLLLEAMADERIAKSNIQLLVAGEFYSNEKKYKDLTKKLGLQNVTWFSEYIPNDNVNLYFCATDVIVQPYKSGTQSGVTQVGYHFEKPMIVTNVGGLAEIIPNGKVGFVVEPNAQSIANAIVRFFENDDSNSFEENIREEKKKYAWDILTQKMRSLF